MPVDEALLRKHRRLRDGKAGFVDTFIQPTLGGLPTVGVLSSPTRDARDVGWVLCPSFGLEQMHLTQHDATVARALAAAGFPVFRYHGQGYGDSHGPREAVSLSSHLLDATDAVSLLAAHEGVARVGVVGTLFGGTVAALVADRLALPLLAMCEPVVSGARYMRKILRTQAALEITSQRDERAEGGRNVEERLLEDGWLDVRGSFLSRRAYQEISAIDLPDGLSRFGGRSIVIGVVPDGEVDHQLRRLVERLGELGGTCTLERIEEKPARPLGDYYFADVKRLRRRVDTRFGFDRQVAALFAAWAARAVLDSGPVIEARA